MKLKRITSKAVGECTNCKNTNLDYGPLNLEEGNIVYYPWTCPKCKTEGKCWYELTFIEMEQTHKY